MMFFEMYEVEDLEVLDEIFEEDDFEDFPPKDFEDDFFFDRMYW